jgi:hypothetical protein
VKYILPALAIVALLIPVYVVTGELKLGFLWVSSLLWVAVGFYAITITLERHSGDAVTSVVMLLIKGVIIVSAFRLAAENLDGDYGFLITTLCLIVATLASYFIGAQNGSNMKDFLTEFINEDTPHEKAKDESPKSDLHIVKAELMNYFAATVLSISQEGTVVKRGDVVATLRAESKTGGDDFLLKIHAEYDGTIISTNCRAKDTLWESQDIMTIKL